MGMGGERKFGEVICHFIVDLDVLSCFCLLEIRVLQALLSRALLGSEDLRT